MAGHSTHVTRSADRKFWSGRGVVFILEAKTPRGRAEHGWRCMRIYEGNAANEHCYGFRS